MYYDLVESGKRIRELRKQFGLTQEELAERLGVALNTISRIEIGQRLSLIHISEPTRH